jgi:hypothetical protein
MKNRMRFFGIAVFVLAGALLSGPSVKAQESPVELGADRLVVIYDPPLATKGTLEWEESGVRYVRDYLKDLGARLGKLVIPGPLTHDMVPEIVAIYGDNGNFTGHDGVTYRGVREISVYLNSLLDCHKITDFRIEPKVVYAKQIPPHLRIDKGDFTVIHSIYFIFSCTFLVDGRLIDPLGSTDCTHVKMCECPKGK